MGGTMAKPRVFVSSTFYDLRDIRDRLREFIESLGYEAKLAERGDIPYEPDTSPAAACPTEAARCDIFVLIIGGRYGSPAPNKGTQRKPTKTQTARYRSVTVSEYEAAREAGAAIYVLVDADVKAEYGTYTTNKGNRQALRNIKWKHVDDVNVFRFLDDIYAQPKNNPVQPFREFSNIRDYLREQWGGLFQGYLSRWRELPTLQSIDAQVAKLTAVADSLQTYAEKTVRKVVPSADKIIDKVRSEQAALIESYIVRHPTVRHIAAKSNRSVATVLDAARRSQGVNDFVKSLNGLVQVRDGTHYYRFLMPAGYSLGSSRVRQMNLIDAATMAVFYREIMALLSLHAPPTGG